MFKVVGRTGAEATHVNTRVVPNADNVFVTLVMEGRNAALNAVKVAKWAMTPKHHAVSA